MEIFIHAKSLRIPLKFLPAILLFFVPFLVSAQNDNQPTINSKLYGKVVDAITKESLPGAVVTIKGTTHAVSTDADGGFKFITGQKFPYTLIVSFIGYEKQELVANGSPIEVQLKPVSKQLNDVVIVGYGSQERKNLVSAVSKIDPSETKSIPDGGFDAQMQGKAAGVQINSNSGIAGSDVFIRVRGTTSINASNDPLYVIDGVFVNTVSLQNIAQQRTASPLADINPADIQSIEILKDASATAIYGSRGANGVVIVTTKRGNYEQKPKVDFNTSQGAAWAPPNRIWKTTTGPEHATLINEYDKNMGITQPFIPVAQGGRGLPEDQPTYDRMAILDRTGQLQNHDLSLQGGSKTTKYYIGGGYNSQEAIWNPISFSRASLKVNLDTKVTEKVSVGISNTLSDTYRNGAFAANGGNGTLLQASLNIPTYLPVFLADGTPAKWVNFDNIYVLANNNNLKSTSLHYIGNFYLDADLLPGLKFHSSWSVDYDNYNESQYWGTQTVLGASPTNGLATASITQSSNLINEQTLSYNKTLGKHSFGILAGNTLQGNVVTNSSESGTNFPNNSYTLISAAAVQTASQSWTKNTLESFFTRVNYNYGGKYYIEFTGRADGSSKFAANHQWGYFPAVGAAWRISEENFLKGVDAISNLKLRASYGIVGNQNGINDFASRGLWNAGYGYADNTTGGEKPGTAPLQLANPNLTWEKTSQADLGLDLSLFKDKLNIGFDLYRKYTTNLLLNVAVPGSTGFSTYLDNYGEVSNKGFELSISSVNIKTKDFSWTTEFNTAQNINKVEKLPAPILYAGRTLIKVQEGSPLYSFWIYKQLGVNPQTGDVIFDDLNKDGKITAADRQIVGNTWPKFFGGFNNTFTFKNFDAGIFITYSYGNNVFNINRMLGETGGTLDANRVLLASQLNRWTTPGQITDVPRLTAANYANYENSRFFEDGSFIRLRSLNVGYTIPKSITSKLHIEKLRVYYVGTNLFLLTKYTGADPETNLGGDQNIQGYDYAIPPMPRSFQFGLNITL
jgi:TonB-linked SusC/RagA family outer membrane protein